MRKQSIILEHDIYWAVCWCHTSHILAVNFNPASAWLFKPSQHAKQGAFAAPRRP